MKVAILDDYQQVALRSADWSGMPHGTEIVSFKEHLDDRGRLAKRLAGTDVIVAMRERTPFNVELMRQLPDLRLLVTTGMRNAAIDLDAASDLGILVCGTGGAGPATAELAWGMIISLARHIPAELETLRSGGWQHTVGVELYGKTLGLVGLGKLGSHMAAIGNAFGMTVVAWSHNLTAERAARCGSSLVSKDELFARSDVISIHLRLSERTRALVGAREIAMMKPSAYLINTSRGPIVDSAALIRVLKERRIAGAGLDVYDEEPLASDDALRTLENLVLTPHIGYVTEENYRIFYGEAVEDILAFDAGRPIRVLNEKVLDKLKSRG